jgi:hypothetical protein
METINICDTCLHQGHCQIKREENAKMLICCNYEKLKKGNTPSNI